MSRPHARFGVEARSRVEVGPLASAPERLEPGVSAALRCAVQTPEFWPLAHPSRFVRPSPALEKFVATHDIGLGDVPVEIKRSCHRDLWSAIKKQLIAKYTRDPGTDGYGIYLVFWFRETERCRPTPGEGVPPKCATDIEKRLRDALSAAERLKISICVIDVSEPSR